MLDYASPIWSPNSIELINRLEEVQPMTTKRIPSIAHLSYNNRLSYLGLQRPQALDSVLICYFFLNLNSVSLI